MPTWMPVIHSLRVLWRSQLAQGALGLATLGLLAAPFLVSFRLAAQARVVGPQHAVAAVRLPAGDLARYTASAARVARSAPIILTYHDIQQHDPHGQLSPYVVTPQGFAEQMAMLAAAGYTTLSAGQLADYLAGGEGPPRSVVISFDDGTHGLWTWADRELARHGFRGMSFVITGRAGTRRPYYLSWEELARMQASGRWDLEAHSRNGHVRIRVDAAGRRGSFFAHRAWLAAERRRETPAEFQRRVEADLAGCIRDFAVHGLPEPRFFAYPFSELLLPDAVAGGGPVTGQVVARLFAASTVNVAHPSPVSRRVAASRRLERLEVRRTTTARELFEAMEQMTSLPVAPRRPFLDPGRWSLGQRGAGPVRLAGDTATVAAGAPTSVAASYAPQATQDWTDYSARVAVHGLGTTPRLSSAGLAFLVGSAQACTVRVSRSWAQVSCGHRKRYAARLEPRPVHRIEVRVRWRQALVRVDGTDRWRLDLRPGAPVTGGIGVVVAGVGHGGPAPVLRGLRVEPVPASVGPAHNPQTR